MTSLPYGLALILMSLAWIYEATMPIRVAFFACVVGIQIDWLLARRPGKAVAAAGALCNVVAVGLNGFSMPVAPQWMPNRTIPLWWHPMTDATRAWWLCDILPYGASVGDVLIFAGMFGAIIKSGCLWLSAHA